jgi:zinc protease
MFDLACRHLVSRQLLPLAAAASVLLAPPCGAQEVKFEKYTLPNGMTVILHEDHGAPVVAVNSWYKVGAKDEPPGRSGFAHLFEHLMFMGTERVPGSDFDNLMEAGGGSNNASTAFDRTNYFSVGPSSLLPTLLWLDADRLEALGRTMTQEKLDLQRDVVRNERRESIENAPYGKAELLITALMFPEGHPYHNEVIGTHEDLEAAQVGDVKDFFATYYVPNNASLVVAGDFDPAVIRPIIADLFGTIARGGDPVHVTAPPVRLDRVVRATAIDQVQLPKICIAYHSPSYYADGDAELDLLAAVLSQGKSSRLYKRLVFDEELAADVAAYQASSALQSVFRIDVTAAEGADLDRIEGAVDEEVARLLDAGIGADELERRKATVELSKVSSLQSVEAKADKLNEYEFYYGDPGSFKRDLDRYRNATPAAVLKWARAVLTPDARVIVRILPDQPEPQPSARDTRPLDLGQKAFVPQAPVSFKLKNGIPVMLWPRPELPLVSTTVLFRPGTPLDDAAHAGRSSLAAAMLEEGAGDLDSVAFGDAVQSLGAAFGAGAGAESATVSMTVVKRNLGAATGLLADALRRPRMDPADWDRVQRLHLEDLTLSEDDPGTVASWVGSRVLYGDASPYAWPAEGSRATVEGLTLDEVKAQQAALFRAGAATILIAGDLTPDEARAILDGALGDWKDTAPRAAPAPSAGSVLASGVLRVVVVDRPGAVQTVVRFVLPGVKTADPNRLNLRLLNTLFGGSFTSRLNQNLRERNGYAYGAGSRFVLRAGAGHFVASSSVRADVTGAAVKEFLAEFDRLEAADITDAEVTKARETFRSDTVQSLEGVSGIVGAAADLLAGGLPFETLGADLAALDSASATSLNALAPSAAPLDGGVLVLVGDKGLILEQIAGLGLPEPVEYTADGRPR